MNLQRSLIRELMLYEFELGYNASEVTKNICCPKDEGLVDHSKVTRWLKKYHSSCKNLTELARLGKPKTVGFEDLLHVRESSASCTSVWFITFPTWAKASVKNF